MGLKNLQDMMTRDKRKKERVKATQNFFAGMSVAVAMTVAAGILVAVKMGKGDENMIIDSKIAVSIKDTVQKKASAIKDSAFHEKQEAVRAINDLRSKAEDIKEDIKS
jgi:ABC-type transport system involved in cytochrome bd biosynthesis fused ATPase/permease subunit